MGLKIGRKPEPKSIQLKHTDLVLNTDGIVEIRCKIDFYELYEIKETIDALGELTNGKKHPVLTIPGKNTHASKEALKFIFSEESTVYTSADAYIAQSLPQRLIGNFYLKLSNSKVPTKLFSNENAAVEWLRKTKNQKTL